MTGCGVGAQVLVRRMISRGTEYSHTFSILENSTIEYFVIDQLICYNLPVPIYLRL